MATPGLGYRTAADVLMECAFHLAQPAVYQNSTGAITPGSHTVTVGSTYAMYPGALLVVEVPGNAEIEVITVTSVTNSTQFVATFVNSHSSGVAIWGATFPTQQATDPIFTQAEMLQYLSRAQNEFLTAVPCNYARFFQTVNSGVIYQATPSTAVLISRIAASALNLGIVSLVRSSQTVTMTTPYPHGLSQYSTFGIASPSGNPIGDTSFLGGAFAVISVPSPTTLTYRQVGADASTTGGALQSMLRLYEVTQEQLTMQNRNWQSSYVGPLQSWFEDRAGLYKWGVGGLPSSNYPVELLCAIRDSDSLGMTDGFLVPDVCLHGTRYLALNYAWSKDGVLQNTQMADFCLKRYTQVVLATQRYIQAMKMGVR